MTCISGTTAQVGKLSIPQTLSPTEPPSGGFLLGNRESCYNLGMDCNCKKPKHDCGVSPATLQINNPSECVLFHKVEIPSSMGDSVTYPPKNGMYRNVLAVYQADGEIFLYDSNGIPTRLTILTEGVNQQYVDNADAQTLASAKLYTDNKVAAIFIPTKTSELTNDSGFITLADVPEGVTQTYVDDQDTATLNSAKGYTDTKIGDLATVASTGDYADLTNTPAIPTQTSSLINDGADGTSNYVEFDDLALVATTGSYIDLTGKPSIPSITMTTTDPGEGAALAENSFIGVYS